MGLEKEAIRRDLAPKAGKGAPSKERPYATGHVTKKLVHRMENLLEKRLILPRMTKTIHSSVQ